MRDSWIWHEEDLGMKGNDLPDWRGRPMQRTKQDSRQPSFPIGGSIASLHKAAKLNRAGDRCGSA
ncbi:hypothetical protein ADU59_20460 [Pararhizobium polonicum]|uniref:Uncharacterized protein n=1 Tax=Pararhizobium polonicum TaxID=1612624 RepID=A0A1C7NX62_9HYPH|nr:hypothetical protein [Pararhizobium polonicum]OBZ93617.1 hypothetical protein ADU59_20460 [Pararhizobium polonicum]